MLPGADLSWEEGIPVAGKGLTGGLGCSRALSMFIPWSRSQRRMGSTSGLRPTFQGTSAMLGSSTV